MRPSSTLHARLAAIGAYTIAKQSWLERLFRMPVVIEWTTPVGLDNDLTRFQLRFCLDAKPRDTDAGCEKLLAAWESFRNRFPVYVPQFKKYLVELFRGCYLVELPPHEKAWYLGPDLQVCDEAILKHVTGGTVGLALERDKTALEVWFDVDWDPEHGAEVEFDAAGNLIRPWRQNA